ncbi:MAG: TPR end-of-group domain-containing protein, partial [Candidatus Thorarchaeota archaeon]
DGHHDEAEGLLRDAISNNISDWAIWDQLGHVLVAKTNYIEAVEAFRKATGLDSSSFFSWLSLGYASKEAKDLDTAISSTTHAMDLAETPLHQGMVLYNLACYTCLSGDNEKALSYLEQCFEKDASIKEWAREDSDLEELRTDSRYIKLLEN